jgi:uncharacterized protein (TIGR00730 family)
MKRLCVFCGSSVGNSVVYADVARQLGTLLATRGIGLIFGGGHIGLMGVLADAVLAGGGEVIGVIPQALRDRELAHLGVTQLHVVPSMHLRKALMADLADAFAALPGGFGTGDEFFEILTWAQLKIHQKPIGVLNTAGFFNGMLTWMDHMVQEGFVKPECRRLVLVAEEPQALIEMVVPE